MCNVQLQLPYSVIEETIWRKYLWDDYGVSEHGDDGIVNLESEAHQARANCERRAAKGSAPMVAHDGVFNSRSGVGIDGHGLCEFPRIFESTTSSLTQIWRHCMICITDERDAWHLAAELRPPVVDNFSIWR